VPHLSEVQAKYKNQVTVLAISDEELDTVAEFMKKSSSVEGKTWAQAMAFTVATDPDKSVKNEVFTAAGRRGIPSSFIIGKGGKIEWIGHPMELDAPLEAVLAGTWDRDAARKVYDEGQAAQKEMTRIRRALGEATSTGDADGAIAILDEAIKKFPDNLSLKMQKFDYLLTRFGRYEEGYALGRVLVSENDDNHMVLNQIAWTIADDKAIKERDLDLAMDAAERANDLTLGKDASILDTLARVHYEKGDFRKALKWQKKAVRYADDGRMGDEIRATLEKYRKENRDGKT